MSPKTAKAVAPVETSVAEAAPPVVSAVPDLPEGAADVAAPAAKKTPAKKAAARKAPAKTAAKAQPAAAPAAKTDEDVVELIVLRERGRTRVASMPRILLEDANGELSGDGY